MGINVCTGILVACCAFLLPYSTHSKMMSVREYFPEIHDDLSKVTWAHAVNSHEKLSSALADTSIMMLEADILMGLHDSSADIQPIMTHPPQKSSDLSFDQFLNTVLKATKSEGKRKGVKLDFKEFEAVEPCLKILKARLEESDAPSIPVFINADILQGPVNSTKKPINAHAFITLVHEYAPEATLSVGWTTRFGADDASEEINDGAYTKQHMKDMLKVLSPNGTVVAFPHITFPVRAGLAARSSGTIPWLTGRLGVGQDYSITLWSAKTDLVDRKGLESFIHQMTARRCLIDLPFSLTEDQDDETDAEVVDNSSQKDPSLSAIQQPEGRNSEDDSMGSAASSSTFLSSSTLLPAITLGLLATVFYAFRRH